MRINFQRQQSRENANPQYNERIFNPGGCMYSREYGYPPVQPMYYPPPGNYPTYPARNYGPWDMPPMPPRGYFPQRSDTNIRNNNGMRMINDRPQRGNNDRNKNQGFQ